MKIIFCLFLFTNSLVYSQKKYSASEINYVKNIYTHYHRNTWKPFSGIVFSEDNKLKSIVEIKNGFAIYSEYYDTKTNELVNKATHTEFEDRYDTIDKKVVLKKLKNQLDISEIQFRKVIIYYNKVSQNSIPKRINGIVESNNSKFYYENGIIIKIEKYYDDKFNKLKERILIFHSPLGNISIENEIEIFHEYKRWDENGKLIDKGFYRNNEYIEN